MFRFFFIAIFLLQVTSDCSTAVKGDNAFYPVLSITDGDTFRIADGSPKGQVIRLIGVDAPESRNSARKKIAPYGKEASDYLVTIIGGKKVRLEYDVDRTDRYGRTLAYVYLDDGTFVNAELVKNGYAMVMTVPPNVKYAEDFLRLYRRARNRGRGLWSLQDRPGNSNN